MSDGKAVFNIFLTLIADNVIHNIAVANVRIKGFFCFIFQARGWHRPFQQANVLGVQLHGIAYAIRRLSLLFYLLYRRMLIETKSTSLKCLIHRRCTL